MKLVTKILVAVALLALVPVVIGLCLPAERQVMRGIKIDQMYFFVLGNISNHWEEPSWRHNLDSMIQKESIDGQDCWMEYYTNGDSIMLLTQTLGEFDYVRRMVQPNGNELTRSITLADYNGATVVRMVEEVNEPDPLKRFVALFSDPVKKRIEQYLSDLKEKGIKQNEEMSGEDGMFGF